MCVCHVEQSRHHTMTTLPFAAIRAANGPIITGCKPVSHDSECQSSQRCDTICISHDGRRVEDCAGTSYASPLYCFESEMLMIRSFCAAILLAGFFLFSPAMAEDEDDNTDKIVAIDRPAAEYPKKAFNKCIEGHVLVRFIITTEGATKDIVVVSARPERVFDKAAIAAVEKWRFEPRVINGVAVNRETTQRLVFEPGCTR